MKYETLDKVYQALEACSSLCMDNHNERLVAAITVAEALGDARCNQYECKTLYGRTIATVGTILNAYTQLTLDVDVTRIECGGKVILSESK